LHISEGGCDVKASKHLASLLTTDWNVSGKQIVQPSLAVFIIFILSYFSFSCCQLPFCEFPKHNRVSLQVWHANVLYFCSFCKPTFSGATREWDAMYYVLRNFAFFRFHLILLLRYNQT
jgi:hypothetical protein